MNNRPAFHVFRDQADFLFNGQIIIGQGCDPETERTIFKNQISRAIVVNELPDVAAFVAERAEALQVTVVASHSVGGEHGVRIVEHVGIGGIRGVVEEVGLPDFTIGRWMVKELNCRGCHLVEAKGWAIRGSGVLPGMEPPMVSGTPTQLQQGQRTQPEWLFAFLKAPTTGLIRPWLKAHMPTFRFSREDARSFVLYLRSIQAP
jgi:hypothetical protein